MAEHEARKTIAQKRYAEARALGRCVTCGDSLKDKRFARCEDCRRRANESQKALAKRRREAGVCRICGSLLAAGSTVLCEKHLTAEREWAANNYKWRQENKRCILCGGARDRKGVKICKVCTDKRRITRAERKKGSYGAGSDE